METKLEARDVNVDVVIVGAGISGINAAQRVQSQLPELTYMVIEARDSIGGTWDLFQYPGIRSDSDLYTLSFAWRPWLSEKAIADGPTIKRYLVESAAEHGIDRKIHFGHKLVSADWASDRQSWCLSVDARGERMCIRAKFMVHGSGYYNYESPMQAQIPGIEDFQGPTIHPQFWPQDLDCSGKKIVIIGSGATAVTIVPVLAQTAQSVTMLQRSPTYIIDQPSSGKSWIAKCLPFRLGHQIRRLRYLMFNSFVFYSFTFFPRISRFLIAKNTDRMLPTHIPRNPHFEPLYDPWRQRICVCPDGDFYAALRSGTAYVVTDTIKTVTATGIETNNGTFLEADIIVTATGLRLRFAGGVPMTVDGQSIDIGEKYLWKGTMMQDVPNAAFMMGYTWASWTLGADAKMLLFCRLLRRMQKKDHAVAIPRVQDESKVASVPYLDLDSTWVTTQRNLLPKGGSSGPWKPRRHYVQDIWTAWFGGLTENLEFQKSA